MSRVQRKIANRGVITTKKKILSRKQKTKKIEIVSRKEQPRPIRTAEVPALKKQSLDLNNVSSSWITALSYDKNTKTATMVLNNGKIYLYYNITFKLFERWYYAHSKGTFHNLYIRGKDYKRIR